MEEENKIVVNNGNSCIPLEIVFDILLRVVSVKPLLRFRCVSKSFCSIISQPLFIVTHQKTCSAAELIVSFPSLSFTRKVIIYKLVQKLEDGQFQAFPFQYLNEPCFSKLDSLESINGLVCLWNDNEDVAIINPFTKQHVFLPKSTERYRYPTFTRCFLGYDPSTKKHKVLKAHLVDDEKGHYKVRHWIFTLGIDNSWREIHGWNHFFSTKDTCVYIDGIIYLVSFYGCNVAAFNVGDETFSLITFPRGVLTSIRHCSPTLVDIKGQVALLDHMTFRDDNGKIFMCILTSNECTQTIWVKHKIELSSELKHLVNTCGKFLFTSNPKGNIILIPCSRYLNLLIYGIEKKEWEIFEISGVHDRSLIEERNSVVRCLVGSVSSLV